LTVGSSGNYWDQWRNIILAEFDGRLGALGAKGYSGVSERKILTGIFLQVKGFQVPVQDILPEAIKIIREQYAQPDNSSFNKEFDAIAMMGHRIGMVENTAGLKQYLHDVGSVLKPEGQILFTVLDVVPASKSEQSLQLQQANLIGPFFNMSRFKADTLKNEAAAANWQCEFIYRQDDNNYLTRLRLSETL
jgi:hypothetical protein